jgi:iron complex outermembrane recepter protein
MKSGTRGSLPATLGVLAGLSWLATGALAQDSQDEAPPDATPPAESAPAESPAGEPASGTTPPPADAPPPQAAPASAAAPKREIKVLGEEPATDGTRFDEIVVTANKRAQFLQDVPMSITAIRGKDLEKRGAKTFIDYAQTVPALNFGYYGEGRSRINIRGLQAPAGVAVVSYIVDGVSQSDTPPDGELFDIDRIEVLRGPQGTLYGEGAVGGAIKVLTNSADPHTNLSKASGSYGFNSAGAKQHDANGMINVPLIDNELGLRVVGFQRHADGYITVREPDFENPPGFKSYSPENILATNANTTDVAGGRASFDWKATPDLTVSAKYSLEARDAGYGPAESPELENVYGPYNVTLGLNPIVGQFTRHDYRQGSVLVSWNTPIAAFESVTGLADVKEDIGTAFLLVVDEALAAAIVGIPPIGPPASGNGVADLLDIRLINQYSYMLQELRMSSIPGEMFTFGGKLNWTAGLFGKLQNREAFQDLYSGPNTRAPDGTGALDGQVNLHFYTAEYAVYGQGEWAFTPEFSVLAGARYYYADLEQNVVGAGGDDSQVYEPTFTDVSPKITLSYHLTDDILFYSTAAKGFRAGGANFVTIAAPNPPPENLPPKYDPDILWSYEVGMNSLWFDRAMTINTAAFLADWDNLQQELRFNNATGQQQRGYQNFGKAKAQGVELETNTSLPWGLSLNVGGAYIDAYMAQDIVNPNDPEDVIEEGTPLENQPKFSCSASLSHAYQFDRGWGLATGIFWNYRGKTHADILNSKLAVSPAYDLWNVQAGLKGPGDAWGVDLFVKNVFDTRASSFTFPHLDTDLPLAWRTIGIKADYSF